ncbi:MAG TPA: NADH:flavin oxidoreductase, partial [Isosphaeraceae bacterium]|nr:NADH:flavin oxidoreductase [Isosphaeraceae bacterium]
YDGLPYQKAEDSLGEPLPHACPVFSAWGTNPEDPAQPDLSEPLRLIGDLRQLGVSLLNITAGNPYASPHYTRPFEYPPPDGYETPEHPLIGVDRHFRLTESVQSAFPDLPVVGSGYSWLQAFLPQAGAANLRDARVTFVGVGRASLSHPDFARTLAAGQPLDPRRTCRTFSYCTALMRSKHNEMGQFPTGCPPFDKPVYGPIWKAAQAPAQS